MPKIVDYEERRQELGTALLEVLARDGIEGVSVRSVAAQAGWTRGVIAHYFADRDELLLYAYRLALQREHAAVGPYESDPLAGLIALLVRALPIDETSSLDYRIFLGLLGRLADRPELAASLASDHAAYEERVLGAVRLAIEAGAIRTALPAKTVATMLSIYVDGLTVGCAIHPGSSTQANLEEQITKFLGTVARIEPTRITSD
ncbi:TetR family transcriptional regulator C-terminal domain-containing protein [Microbacterium lacus]|uniref:TetR/AcrR family transcriptional regulator n=1 Tax=Microbacterium lacus TaxID=415217 RepID=UPI0038505673